MDDKHCNPAKCKSSSTSSSKSDIEMKADHSRNGINNQNNHYKYKIYSSGERELDDVQESTAKASKESKGSFQTKNSANTDDKQKVSSI